MKRIFYNSNSEFEQAMKDNNITNNEVVVTDRNFYFIVGDYITGTMYIRDWSYKTST